MSQTLTMMPPTHTLKKFVVCNTLRRRGGCCARDGVGGRVADFDHDTVSSCVV